MRDLEVSFKQMYLRNLRRFVKLTGKLNILWIGFNSWSVAPPILSPRKNVWSSHKIRRNLQMLGLRKTRGRSLHSHEHGRAFTSHLAFSAMKTQRFRQNPPVFLWAIARSSRGLGWWREKILHEILYRLIGEVDEIFDFWWCESVQLISCLTACPVQI